MKTSLIACLIPCLFGAIALCAGASDGSSPHNGESAMSRFFRSNQPLFETNCVVFESRLEKLIAKSIAKMEETADTNKLDRFKSVLALRELEMWSDVRVAHDKSETGVFSFEVQARRAVQCLLAPDGQVFKEKVERFSTIVGAFRKVITPAYEWYEQFAFSAPAFTDDQLAEKERILSEIKAGQAENDFQARVRDAEENLLETLFFKIQAFKSISDKRSTEEIIAKIRNLAKLSDEETEALRSGANWPGESEERKIRHE